MCREIKKAAEENIKTNLKIFPLTGLDFSFIMEE
jgi:hypothetical protein